MVGRAGRDESQRQVLAPGLHVPLGLAAFANQHSGGWGLFAACIGIYFAQAYFYFRSRKVWSTLLLFGGLVGLLICNVSGCRAMLNTH